MIDSYTAQKGTIIYCHKDLFMSQSTDRVFTKNKKYIVKAIDTRFSLLLVDDEGDNHYLDKTWCEYFTKYDIAHILSKL